MRYGLEQFKQIADELLGSFKLGSGARAGISAACADSSRHRGWRFGAWPIYTAAGLLTCAVIVLAVYVIGMPQTSVGGTGGDTYAQSSVDDPALDQSASAFEGSAVIVSHAPADNSHLMPVKASDTIPEGLNFTVEKNESGLFGLKDTLGNWVVEPIYEKGVISGDTVIFTLGGNEHKYPLADFAEDGN